jgi:ABC-type molybdate transport system permease subunit
LVLLLARICLEFHASRDHQVVHLCGLFLARVGSWILSLTGVVFHLDLLLPKRYNTSLVLCSLSSLFLCHFINEALQSLMLFEFWLDVFSSRVIRKSFIFPARDHGIKAADARSLREAFDLKGIHQAEDMSTNKVVECLEGAATVDLLGDQIPFN